MEADQRESPLQLPSLAFYGNTVKTKTAILAIVIGISNFTFAGDVIVDVEKVLSMTDTVAVVKIMEIESSSEIIEGLRKEFKATYKVKIEGIIAGDTIEGEIKVPFGFTNGFRASEMIYHSEIEEGLRTGMKTIFLLQKDAAHRTYGLLRAEGIANKDDIKTMLKNGVSLLKREETGHPIKKAIETYHKTMGVAWNLKILRADLIESERLKKYFPYHRFYDVKINNPSAEIKGPKYFTRTLACHYNELFVLSDIPKLLSEAQKFNSDLKPIANSGLEYITDIAYMYSKLSQQKILSAPYKKKEVIQSDWDFQVKKSGNIWQVNYTLEIEPFLQKAQRFTINVGEFGKVTLTKGKVVESVYGGYR